MTPECTGFTEEEIYVLIKVNANILHVCNSCTEKNGTGDLSQAPSTKMDGKLDDLDLKVETLNKQIEKSNEFIISIKAELSELKIRPQSYAASLGTIAIVKVFYPSANDNGMGIRVRGIPENESKSPDERLHADMKAFEEILCYLKVEAKQLCKVTRIGKYNPEKGPRTILINLESPISK